MRMDRTNQVNRNELIESPLGAIEICAERRSIIWLINCVQDDKCPQLICNLSPNVSRRKLVGSKGLFHSTKDLIIALRDWQLRRIGKHCESFVRSVKLRLLFI